MSPPGRPPIEERQVGGVMSTDLLAVTEHESAVMAWELMRQGGHHHLPVLGDGSRLIDVVDAETLAAAWESGGPDRMRRPVGDYLRHRTLPHVSVEDTVATAARAMLAAGLDFVPVLDDAERLVGLFTAGDLVALAAGRREPAHGAHVTGPTLYRIEPVLPEPPTPRGTRPS